MPETTQVDATHGERDNQPYTLSMSLDKMVFPKVIPFRASYINDPMQIKNPTFDDEKWFYWDFKSYSWKLLLHAWLNVYVAVLF